MFQNGFAFTQHHKEIINLYFSIFIIGQGYNIQRVVNKNNYTLFEKNNLEIGFGNWELVNFKFNFLNLV